MNEEPSATAGASPRPASDAPPLDAATPHRGGSRFTLRGLFAAAAAAALLVAPVPYLGEMYAAFLVFGGGMMAWCLYFAAYLRGTTVGLFACIGAPFLRSCFFTLESKALLLQAAVTAVGLLATCRMANYVRLRAGICIGAFAIPYLYGCAVAIHRDQQYLAVSNRFPLESLAARLEGAKKPKPILLTPSQAKALDDRKTPDRDAWWVDRREILAALFDRGSRRTELAIGFGRTRKWYIRPDDGERAEPEPVDDSPIVGYGLSFFDFDIHLEIESSFTDASAMGYVKDIDRVAGFLPHSAASSKSSIDYLLPESVVFADDLKFARLELVSLLLHDEPVAYVSDRLPDLAKLRNGPTRPLDDFERDALAKLQGPSDLETLEENLPDGGYRIRMLGSIRASEQCLACHDATRGALLGALTYDLRQAPTDWSEYSPVILPPTPKPSRTPRPAVNPQ